MLRVDERLYPDKIGTLANQHSRSHEPHTLHHKKL